MRRSLSSRKLQYNFKEEDIIYCNWLKKQGGKFKTLRRRYFVLVQQFLYYFTNDTKYVLKGQINLKNLELSELEEDKDNEYNFFILPEKGKDFVNENHVKYLLSTNDKNHALKWIFFLKQSMYLDRGGGLFGTPLSLVMPHLKEEFSYVPRIIHECCQYITEHGLDEEGIFRKNGQLSLVIQMKEQVDRANYNWEEPDVHTVCSLLKLYLRELPEPLIPFSNYDSLKAVGYRIDANENLDLVREKLKMLPVPNHQLLKYLCTFLTKVSNHPENRMEIISLAKIFSPNILRDQDTDPYVEESTNTVITVTVAAFIKSHEDLFQFEYEPLNKYDGDSKYKDEDTYSLNSAFSYMNCTGFSSPDDDHNKILGSQGTSNRVQSMIIFNDSQINTYEHTRSQDTVVNTVPKPKLELSDYSEKTPILPKKLSLTNGTSNNKNAIVLKSSCENCAKLQNQLILMTDNRDRLQNLFDVKSQTCKQLQEEISEIRNQLTLMKKQRSENTCDLSDVLEYFQINKH